MLRHIVVAFFCFVPIFSQDVIKDYDWRFFYTVGQRHFSEKHFLLAADYFHRSEQLIKAGRILVDEDPRYKDLESYMVFTALGDCYANLDKSYRAAEYYQISLELEDKQIWPNLFLATYFFEKTLYRNSLPFFEKYVLLSKQDADAWAVINYAVTLAALRQNQQALQLLDRYAARPLQSNANRQQCLTHENKKQWSKARQCYIDVLYQNMNRLEAYLDLARFANAFKDEVFDANYHVFRFSLDLSRQFQTKAEMINDVAELHLTITRFAYMLFSEDKQAVWPYFFRLYKNRYFHLAEKVARDYLTKFGEDQYGLFQLAEVLREQNKKIEAQEIYRKIQELQKKETDW